MTHHTDPHPVIEVDGVRRRYTGRSRSAAPFEAVRAVDLDIRRGELFALLGTNGAGKTSLVELLEGLAEPTAGRIRVLGYDPYRQRHQVRHRTGVVLQESGFPGDLKVREMAAAWARTLSRPRPVAEVLDEVGLGHRAGVATASLSGGERRRLDLALAVLGRPEVLFLDEPTTGLDPESRRSAWDLVRSLVRGGTTVLLTTHYLEEAEQLADRIAIMHAGEVVRRGTPAELAAQVPARITFQTDDDGVLPSRGRAWGGQHTTEPGPAGTRHTIVTEDLQRELYRLLAWADAHDVALGGLDALTGTLEQLFLDIARSGPGSGRSADAHADAPVTEEVSA